LSSSVNCGRRAAEGKQAGAHSFLLFLATFFLFNSALFSCQMKKQGLQFFCSARKINLKGEIHEKARD
jgi:hypothetical protein